MCIAAFPFIQFVAHIWIGLYAVEHGMTFAAGSFLFIAIGSDFLFFWLLLYFARQKFAAFRRSLPVIDRNHTESDHAVTILIPTKEEELTVVEETFRSVCQIRHRPLRILVVENSLKMEHQNKVLELARDYGLDAIAVENRGNKAAALNDAMHYVETPFVAVLDADVVVSPNFVEILLPQIQGDERIAFVQAPQADRNRRESYFATAGSLQQAYFYEFIAYGLGTRERALCVGTNCIFRSNAIREVGGWPEDTVSEDVAISWQMHRIRYRSRYVSDCIGFGLAPCTMMGFFVQRARHAQGACQLIMRVLRDPNAPLRLRLHYLFLASFPLVSVAYILYLAQVILSLFIIKLNWEGYILQLSSVFAIVTTQAALILGMPSRGYRPMELMAGQGGTLLALPAYLYGIYHAVTGRFKGFRVTPKSIPRQRTEQPRHSVSVHAALVGLFSFFISIVWTLQDHLGILVFAIWLAIHGIALLAPLVVNSRTANSKRIVSW